MLFEVVRDLPQHYLEVGTLTEQLIVTCLLRQKHRHAHKVQETQCLICMLLGVNDEFEHFVDFVNLLRSLHNVLQVEQVGQDFEHLVPDSLREVLGVRSVDLQERLSDASVDCCQVLGNKELDNENIPFEVATL